MSFTEFLQEKQYLQNVSSNTLRWYRHALKWLPSEQPDQRALNDMVIRMRQKGLKATGCNAAIRAINCYLKWSKSPHKLKPLREEHLVMPTFTSAQVKLLIRFSPRTEFERRLHILVLLLLDTGCRISEALGLHAHDIDWDNLLLTLHGKGRKDRKVPISLELRKALFKYRRDGPLFLTSKDRPWGRVGALRSVKLHCHKLGFEPPARTLHAVRHTFSLNYLRRGGSLFHLQQVLGHTSLEMTRRYVALMTEDLSETQKKVSLLSAAI